VSGIFGIPRFVLWTWTLRLRDRFRARRIHTVLCLCASGKFTGQPIERGLAALARILETLLDVFLDALALLLE
jgi:hypothetical protein